MLVLEGQHGTMKARRARVSTTTEILADRATVYFAGLGRVEADVPVFIRRAVKHDHEVIFHGVPTRLKHL